MPDFAVHVVGLDQLLAKLKNIENGVQSALDRAAARLARDGTEVWQRQVRVRTGRMRGSLHAVARRAAGGGVDVVFAIGRAGFYYQWQAGRRAWTAALVKWLQANAATYITREVDALIQRS